MDAGEGAALPADGQTLSLLGRRLRTASEAASEPQSGSCVRLLGISSSPKVEEGCFPSHSKRGTLVALTFFCEKTNMFAVF
jgi:hypothetical protein